MTITNRYMLTQYGDTGDTSEKNDDPRIDHTELLKQMDSAVRNVGCGRFVRATAILHGAREVNATLVESDLLDRGAQPLPGSAHKRSA